MKSAKTEPQQGHTSVGGWVAATRKYPLLELEEAEEEEEPEEDTLSDDGGIDMEGDLGLDNATVGLQSVTPPSAMEKPFFATPRIDSYRFSMATLEDSQDVELDAILGELCALENQFDREIFSGSRNHQRSVSSVSQSSGVSSLDSRPPCPQQQLLASMSMLQSLALSTQSGVTPSHSMQRFSLHSRSSSAGAATTAKPKFELVGLESVVMDDGGRLVPPKTGEMGPRTDSPDNDSAFSDTVSMLSSESSASSGGGGSGVGARNELSNRSESSKSCSTSPTRLNAEHVARIKAEKIKIALEKIREASIKKLFIKAFTADGSAKSLLVDEKMSVGYVTKLLVDKNHVALDLRWSIVERVQELYMERVFEDHENLVENLMLWTRDSKNKLLFLERTDKFDPFVHPENYFLASDRKRKDFDDDSRTALIEEFFSGNGVAVPEVEGYLYLKSDGKKAWKKHYFVLRASGLYYCPKGKSKLSKDLVCLVTFDTNQVYLGVGWKKKYKAPAEFGFALKHAQIQTKASKYIKYLCAEDERSLRQWVAGIRTVKCGRQLLHNYRMLLQDMVEDDLDALAHARSFSVSSVARSATSSQCTTPSAPTTPVYESAEPPRAPSSSGSSSDPHSSSATPVSTLERGWSRSVSRQDSVRSSSTGGSGGPSERSGNGTPTGGEMYGFECDFPMGTIKRKPSVNAKIPLTNTTRTLAKQSMGDEEFPPTEGEDGVTTRSGTLRKKTLRRSLTDDKISIPELVQTQKRQQTLLRHESPTSPSGGRSFPRVGMLEYDSFGLTPPPPEFAASMESLLSVDLLPLPPPPDAYKSNLSLDSLPPPPLTTPTPPSERRGCTGLNLPPPPPSAVLLVSDNVRHNPTKCSGGGSAPVPPPKPCHRLVQEEEVDVVPHVPPPFLAELKAQALSPNILHRQSPKSASSPSAVTLASLDEKKIPNGYHLLNGHNSDAVVHRLKSPTVCRRITFRDEVSVIGSPVGRPNSTPAPPPPPPLPTASALRPRAATACMIRKPSPPQRSESTRLSGGRGQSQSMTYSQITSPRMFLADLQRVIEKKWKVAQQLKLDLNSSPHTVMGFRDPPLPSDVLCCTTHIDEKNRAAAAKAQALSLTVSSPPSPLATTTPSSPPPGMLRGYRDGVRGHAEDSKASSLGKKKLPPPPPPKRSETTQLTSRTQ